MLLMLDDVGIGWTGLQLGFVWYMRWDCIGNCTLLQIMGRATHPIGKAWRVVLMQADW